jgi:hypothetical protein
MSMGMGEAIGAGPEVAEQFFKGNYAKKNTCLKEIATQDFLPLLFLMNFLLSSVLLHRIEICCEQQTKHFTYTLLTFYSIKNYQKEVLNAYI